MDAITLTRADVDELVAHLTAISARIPLRPIRTRRDYQAATARLNALLDAGGADEKHPLAPLVTLLGELIGEYEDSRPAPTTPSPAEVLRLLMEQHRLGQSDLPDVGSQGVVSELLSGKRDLNVRQIRSLAERFNVSPALFM